MKKFAMVAEERIKNMFQFSEKTHWCLKRSNWPPKHQFYVPRYIKETDQSGVKIPPYVKKFVQKYGDIRLLIPYDFYAGIKSEDYYFSKKYSELDLDPLMAARGRYGATWSFLAKRMGVAAIFPLGIFEEIGLWFMTDKGEVHMTIDGWEWLGVWKYGKTGEEALEKICAGTQRGFVSKWQELIFKTVSFLRKITGPHYHRYDSVKFLGARRALLFYLEKLTDREYQLKEWSIPNQSQPIIYEGNIMYHSFTELVHFFFDDRPLHENPSNLIGYVLKNPEEVEAIKKVTHALDVVLDDVGTLGSDEEYITNKHWDKVMATAREAVKIVKD